MPFAELPGVHLWYEDSGGSGVPVVLMHAASGSSESWIQQVPEFAAAGYRCIAYDRRFCCRSEPDPAGSQPGYAIDDLLELVRSLDLRRFHLIGTAAGAGPSLEFAVVHPERVRSLVMADCIGGVHDAELQELQARLRPGPIQALPVELRELSAGYRGTNAEGTARWIEIARVSWPEGAEAQRQPRKTELMPARLEAFRTPTMALAGEADLVTPPAYVRLLASRLPNCEFATVPEAGHASFWEQPAIWNRLVLDFIGRH